MYWGGGGGGGGVEGCGGYVYQLFDNSILHFVFILPYWFTDKVVECVY